MKPPDAVLWDHIRQWVAKAEVESIKMLSPFGVKIRYPGDFPELLPGQEQTLFELAKRAREAVTAQLGARLAAR